MPTKIEIALVAVLLGSGVLLAGAAIIESPTPFITLGQVSVIGFCIYGLCLILSRIFSAELNPEIMAAGRLKSVSQKEKKELIATTELYLNMYNTISECSNEMLFTDKQAAFFNNLCNSILRLNQKRAEGTYEQIEQATNSLVIEMKKNSEHPQFQNIVLFEKDGFLSFHEDRRVIRNADSVLDCFGVVMHQDYMKCVLKSAGEGLGID